MSSPAIKPSDKALILDFSSSSVRILYWDGRQPYFDVYSLPPWLFREQQPVLESVEHVLAVAEEQMGVPLRGGGSKILLVGELASLKLNELLITSPIDPASVIPSVPFPTLLVRSRLYSFGKRSLRQLADPKQVVRWLPFSFNPHELDDYLHNLNLFTQVYPDTLESLYIRQAIVRQRLQELSSCLGESDYKVLNEQGVCLVGGVFSEIAHPSQALSVFLDGFRPRGAVFLKRDTAQWLVCLAALEFVGSALAKEIYNFWWPDELGTVVGLGGEANCVVSLKGQPPFEIHVGGGELVRVPLEAGSSGVLKARTKRGVAEYKLYGGQAGVIFDARPFKLTLPDSFTQRKELLQKWDREVGGHGQTGEL